MLQRQLLPLGSKLDSKALSWVGHKLSSKALFLSRCELSSKLLAVTENDARRSLYKFLYPTGCIVSEANKDLSCLRNKEVTEAQNK